MLLLLSLVLSMLRLMFFLPHDIYVNIATAVGGGGVVVSPGVIVVGGCRFCFVDAAVAVNDAVVAVAVVVVVVVVVAAGTCLRLRNGTKHQELQT